jgi:hypothetical protein
MNFRHDSLNSIERRIRRRLGRHNYDLLRAQKLTPKVQQHGGYKIRDASTGDVIFGEAGYEFSADLDDIEAWLDTLDV